MTDFTHKFNSQPTPDMVRNAILAKPGFGDHFSDNMSHIRYTKAQGWHGHEVIPYGPLVLDPAAAVFHYAQEIFEGLKAYRHADGSVWTFRPQKNSERMNKSAQRLALPQITEDDFVGSIRELVAADQTWVPTPAHEADEVSLYLRPFMIASETFLGVRASQTVDYYVIASPAAAYFAGGVKPVRIWLTHDLKRSGFGGTGFAKCGGNYAASLLAGEQAAEKGCQQVMFTDAKTSTYLEELGGMNLMLVTKDGELLTPKISETILDGVTRRSILDLAPSMGLTPVERDITVDEWRAGAASGHIIEAFACGTAAVVTPIGSLVSENFTIDMGVDPGENTMKIRKTLLDIQYGRAEGPEGWMVKLV